MEIITFLVVGLLAGWIASVLVKGRGSGVLSDIVIGVIGAFVGGFVFRLFDLTTYSFYGSLWMSVIGAVVFLLVAGIFQKRSHQGKITQ